MSSRQEQVEKLLGNKKGLSELKSRILFVIGALIIYRMGTFLPVPGVNPAAMAELLKQNSGGLIDMFNMFSGGALGRYSIFALGVMPYISASIIMSLMTAVSPHLESLKKEGQTGRTKINQYTRYATLLLASLQGYGIAVGLEGMEGSSGSAVIDSGYFFRISTVITLTGGTLFLMWLGEQITQRGIGNGISLIIFTGIVANLPRAITSTLELGRTGALSTLLILFIIFIVIAVIAFIVFIERSYRKVIVQYPRRQMGNKMFEGDNSHMPLKLNTAGVIPPIFASSLLLLPMTIAGFSSGSGPDWVASLVSVLGRGQPLYLLIYVSFIVFFAFFYTSIVFNPEETAENLRKNGGFVPGIRPGENTAVFLDHVLTRLTTIGAIYLAAVCILPEIMMSKYSVPFYFGGTSLLIVVNVTMDTVTQVQSHLIAHQYEGLLKKARLRER